MIQPTVHDFAAKYGCMSEISRAISFDPKLAPLWQVPVRWNSALRNSAGRASRQGIELHPGLQVQGREALRSTLLHECAHVMDHLLHAKWGHSITWVIQMARLGADPVRERHHNYAPCMQSADYSAIAKSIDPSIFG